MKDYLAVLVTLLIKRIRHLNQIIVIVIIIIIINYYYYYYYYYYSSL